MVRNSERSTFLRCRQLWHWTFNDRLKPTSEPYPLRFGALIHGALALWYKPGTKRGTHPARTFKRLYKKELERAVGFGFKDETGEWHSALDLGVAMLNGYVEHYGKDSEWEVLATEQPFEVDVHNPRTGRYVYTYVGVFDGLWRNRRTRKLWIPDHKTAKSIRPGYLSLDEQVASYWTYGIDWLEAQGILKPKQKLAGMVFNFLRKAMPDERERNADGLYLNQNGEVSKNQPPIYFHREDIYRSELNRVLFRDRVYDEVREMQMIRAGKLAVYKSPSFMNCPGCPLKDMCELHEAGQDWETYRDQTTREWDPYSEHELYNRS